MQSVTLKLLKKELRKDSYKHRRNAINNDLVGRKRS